MLTGPVEGVVKDLAMRLRNLSGKSIEGQISDLSYVIAKARWSIAELEKERRFERTLEIFNRHGAEANPPFGAMLINGRVLVCNYRTAIGVWVNGHVVDKSFITREVKVRRDWPKGEKGYERNQWFLDRHTTNSENHSCCSWSPGMCGNIEGGGVMRQRMIEELVRDLKDLVQKLPGLTTPRQIEELNIMATTTKWVANILNADLTLERDLSSLSASHHRQRSERKRG